MTRIVALQQLSGGSETDGVPTTLNRRLGVPSKNCLTSMKCLESLKCKQKSKSEDLHFLVHPKRLELPTFGSVDQRSIQLS